MADDTIQAEPTTREASPEAPEESGSTERRCTVCDVKLSSYNPGPNCWSHTIGHPWRGPTAKPKFDD